MVKDFSNEITEVSIRGEEEIKCTAKKLWNCL
jgi:hypothetical protein